MSLAGTARSFWDVRCHVSLRGVKTEMLQEVLIRRF
jgi:hypothetical protein